MPIKRYILALLACSSVFAAVEISRTGMRDETVSAEYNWVDNNCISRHLEIESSKTRTNDTGTRTNESVTVVNYSIYNFCDPQNRKQSFYHGKSSAAQVAVDPLLRSASVRSNAFPVNEIIGDGMGNVT